MPFGGIAVTMQRWEEVYNEIQRKSERIGYNPPTQIGGRGSQVFEFRINKQPVLLLAFRDLARKPDYKLPNDLWAEGLELILTRLDEISKQGKERPQAAAIVTDNIGNAFVVVMMDELIEMYQQKGSFDATDGHRRFTFVVQRDGNKYSLRMPNGQPSKPLTSVNSVESLLLLLKAAKSPRNPR
jgi:hypothetical protein